MSSDSFFASLAPAQSSHILTHSWKKKAREITKIEQAMPRSRCATTAAFQHRMFYVKKHLTVLTEFYGARRWVRIK